MNSTPAGASRMIALQFMHVIGWNGFTCLLLLALLLALRLSPHSEAIISDVVFLGLWPSGDNALVDILSRFTPIISPATA